MTDRARARWTAAAALTPVAAAVFAGATAWAVGHAPATPAGSAAGSTATSSGGSAGAASGTTSTSSDLQQTLDDDAARISALERVISGLRTELATLQPGAGTTTPGTMGSGTTGSGTAGSRSLVRQAPQPAPVPRAAVRRAAQAPAVHTVTGGS